MKQIFCQYDEVLPVGSLKENPHNPNLHPIAQVEALACVISENGWRNPIVVSRGSGFVVKGHGRLAAAKLMGEESVPVEYQDYASEAEERADLLADNRLSALSIIDEKALVELISGATESGMALGSFGFTDSAFSELERSIDAGSAEGGRTAADPSGDDLDFIKIGPYRIPIKRDVAKFWLSAIYEKFNGDEVLVFAEVRRRLKL